MGRKKTKYDLETICLKVVREMLAECPGQSRDDYAEMLGISERQFYRWIEKFHLDIPKRSSRRMVIHFARPKKNKLAPPGENENFL